jgi:tetratricopeptide (TPR) repeat protein
VLEGSVQRSGNEVRVDPQLINAETDTHLWAERFDRDMGDLFVLQNEITSRLANALGAELVAAEAARPTDTPDVLDYILRGRAALLKPASRDSLAEAVSLFEHALSLDPRSVEAQARLAGSLAGRVLNGMTDSAAADLARADELIDRALAASPRYALAHVVKGDAMRARNRCEEAILEYESALVSNSNLPGVLNGLGLCKLSGGSIDEVIPLVEQARTDEAKVWLEKGRSAGPAKPFIRAELAAAYALGGDLDRAATELAEARRLRGEGSFSSIAKMKRGVWRSLSPKTRALYEATYFAGLRKAGMPEE